LLLDVRRFAPFADYAGRQVLSDQLHNGNPLCLKLNTVPQREIALVRIQRVVRPYEVVVAAENGVFCDGVYPGDRHPADCLNLDKLGRLNLEHFAHSVIVAHEG